MERMEKYLVKIEHIADLDKSIHGIGASLLLVLVPSTSLSSSPTSSFVRAQCSCQCDTLWRTIFSNIFLSRMMNSHPTNGTHTTNFAQCDHSVWLKYVFVMLVETDCGVGGVETKSK